MEDKRVLDHLIEIKTQLATNTAITSSLSAVVNEVQSSQKIGHDEMKDIKNAMLRMESWKNGQINYQQQTLVDVKNLNARLSPIEQDFIERTKKKVELEKNWSGIVWKGIEKVVLIIAGAILISWQEIASKIFK